MKKILIVGVSWIGDTIMSMPAVQQYGATHPDTEITILAKPAPAALWQLNNSAAKVLTLHTGLGGTRAAVRRIRQENFDEAYVFPHSFRSALIPFLARIPIRKGMPGHSRDWMLTEIKDVSSIASEHQAHEYSLLMNATLPQFIEVNLSLSEAANARAAERLDGLQKPFIGFIPGAARGPSKRWPENHFIELGKMLTGKYGGQILLFGSDSEVDLCQSITDALGGSTLNLAGETSLEEWAALLNICQLVIANDSGGMHLAAATGTPLVAIFGITNPGKTGPLGKKCTVIQQSTVRARDIKINSALASRELDAIIPAQVFEKAAAILDQQGIEKEGRL